jgi:integrase
MPRHTGLRVDEVCGADLADLGMDRGHRVLTVLRKGARKAKIPLTPATGAALDVAKISSQFPTSLESPRHTFIRTPAVCYHPNPVSCRLR